MTGTADWLLWGSPHSLFSCRSRTPAGSSSAPAIAIVLLGGRYGLPFVGDYLKSRQSGVGQAKAQRKLRDTMRRNDDERNR